MASATKTIGSATSVKIADLKGKRVFVDPSCMSHAVQKGLHVLECIQVSKESQATVFVVANPFLASTQTLYRVKFAATLVGGCVCTPDVVMQTTNGPIMKYKCALSVGRKCWVSPAFQHAHPHLWCMILEVASAFAQSKWSWLTDMGDYVAAKEKAMRAKSSSTVVALCSTEECSSNLTVPHVYDHSRLLEFISTIDVEQSVLGLGDL